VYAPQTELKGVTCRMGSHRVTFHLTQVNTPYQPTQPQSDRLVFE